MRAWRGAALFLLFGVAAPVHARGYLGLELAPVTRAAAARAPLLAAHGALIVRVLPDSAADRAGIKPGEILARINGRPVASARDAARRIRAGRAGEHIRLSLFDIVRGAIHPHDKMLTFAAAPPVTRALSVRPPRLLAEEMPIAPVVAANAAWSRRMRGAANPLALARLAAGGCSAFAPQDWTVFEARGDLFHAVSGDKKMHAIYKSVTLDAGQARAPRRFAIQLLTAIFAAAPQPGLSQSMRFGFHRFDFGTPSGVAGFVVYRLSGRRHLAMWIAAVPAGDVAALEPIAAAVLFSIHCTAEDARTVPTPPHLAPTLLSVHCRRGRCAAGDLAAAALARFHKGYVHNADGAVFLVDPRRDLWAMGPQGPGYYRQSGGLVEKLEPGRTN